MQEQWLEQPWYKEDNDVSMHILWLNGPFSACLRPKKAAYEYYSNIIRLFVRNLENYSLFEWHKKLVRNPSLIERSLSVPRSSRRFPLPLKNLFVRPKRQLDFEKASLGTEPGLSFAHNSLLETGPFLVFSPSFWIPHVLAQRKYTEHIFLRKRFCTETRQT